MLQRTRDQDVEFILTAFDRVHEHSHRGGLGRGASAFPHDPDERLRGIQLFLDGKTHQAANACWESVSLSARAGACASRDRPVDLVESA